MKIELSSSAHEEETMAAPAASRAMAAERLK
jgi:hypothetical protein